MKKQNIAVSRVRRECDCTVINGRAAQSYPTKPIRMIVAYPPGGGTDIVGRMVAQKLSENFGQTVVIDNRGGAAGGIGSEIAAHSVPDGYTIIMGNVAPNAINVSLYAKLGYDPVKDFEPVSLVASTPNILVVLPSLASQDGARADRARQGQAGVAQLPVGRARQLVASRGRIVRQSRRRQMVHVPYKGGGPALTDLLGGQVQLMFATMPAAMPHVRSGGCAQSQSPASSARRRCPNCRRSAKRSRITTHQRGTACSLPLARRSPSSRRCMLKS